MRPRPDWLRVVDGGVSSPDSGSPESGESPSARAALRRTVRRSGAYRCATPLPLPDRTLDVEEQASFRWNASPWTKWLPAVLCCSVLSGAMFWNLGRVWLERADAPLFAWRPTNITIAGSTPDKPAGKAPGGTAPAADAPVKVANPAPKPAKSNPVESSDTLGLLAAASLLASLPPDPACAAPAAPTAPIARPAPSAPTARPASRPAAPAPAATPRMAARAASEAPEARPAPVVRQERIIRVIPVHAIPVQDEAAVEAQVERLGTLLDGLPADARREIVDSVLREVRAYYRDAQNATVRGAVRDARRDANVAAAPTPAPPGVQVADERPLAGPGDGPRIILYDDGGSLRVRLQKLTAPATPRG